MGDQEIYFVLFVLLTGLPGLVLLTVSIKRFGQLRLVSGIVWLFVSASAFALLLLRLENPMGSLLIGFRELRFFDSREIRLPLAQIQMVRQLVDGVGFAAAAGAVTFFVVYRSIRGRKSGAHISFWVGVMIFGASSFVLGTTRNFADDPDSQRLWHWLGAAICGYGVYHVWQALAGLGQWEREGPRGYVFGCLLLVFSLASLSHGARLF